MAKTIKFNLICDNVPVRTIEDLQNNFSIEDVLVYFNNGLLERWLEVRNYAKELEAVRKIKSNSSIEIIEKLIDIFDIETDINKVKEKIYILKHKEVRNDLLDQYQKEDNAAKHIISDYCDGYDNVVADILNHPTDVPRIKSNLNEIVNNYFWAFDLDHRSFFYQVFYASELIILCMLMNNKMRDYYLPKEITLEDGRVVKDIDINTEEYDPDKAAMFERIKEISVAATKADFQEKYADYVKTFSGVTDGYWKDLETKDKKYMVVSIGGGDYVRAAGETGGDLAAQDVLNKFKIIQGIDYKSNSDRRTLIYMEV